MARMQAREAAKLFESWLETERRASPNTVLAYRRDLASLLELVGDKKVSAIDVYKLRSWLGGLARTHSPASVARKIAAARALIRACTRESYVGQGN